MPVFRLGELFCGPGGLAWGAVNADIGNPQYRIVHQEPLLSFRSTLMQYHPLCHPCIQLIL